MARLMRRRDVMRGGTAGLALLLAGPARALPGQDELRRILGRGLPAPLQAVVPAEALEAADLVRQLIGLEREAKVLRLPPSLLSLGEGAIPTDPEQLYQLAMPRLVALIDRAEARNPGFADKAGLLLARLHQTQHVAAEGFAGLAAAPIAPLGFIEPAVPAPQPLAIPPPAEDGSETAAPALPSEPATAAPVPAAASPGPAVIARSLKFAEIEAEYAAMFASLQLRESNRESAQWHVRMMRQSRSRYAAAGRRTGVPWYFIAAVHGLEASFNFRAHFHNGDFPLTQRTRQVPAGRPSVWLPPSDWESSAADALRLMGFAGERDWSLPHTLYRLEAFNGFGYRRMGRATPYLWSFSTHYERGKFVADGRFDPRARSQQCGAAVLLKLLEQAGELQAEG